MVEDGRESSICKHKTVNNPNGLDLSKYFFELNRDANHLTKFRTGELIIGSCCDGYISKRFVFR